MASSVVWSGCFDPPQLPEYVTEMADLDDPNVTKTEWEQQKAAEAAQDAGNQADDDVTDNDASATGPDGSVEPTCTNGDPCDSEGDTDKCEDDVWTLCESEDPVCQNVIGTVCEIDGVCVDAGSHNPENTCLVCDPGEAATASTDWTPIETGKLCDEHGLFGTCEPDGLGGMECTEQPDEEAL